MEVTKYKRPLPKGNGKPVLVDGARSAFVKSFGVFEDCDALELFSRTIDGLVRKVGLDPQELDEVSCGVVVPQTKNANVARDAVHDSNTLLIGSTVAPSSARMLAAVPRLHPELRPVALADARRLEGPLEGGAVYTDDKAPVEWLVDKSLLEYAGGGE